MRLSDLSQDATEERTLTVGPGAGMSLDEDLTDWGGDERTDALYVSFLFHLLTCTTAPRSEDEISEETS